MAMVNAVKDEVLMLRVLLSELILDLLQLVFSCKQVFFVCAHKFRKTSFSRFSRKFFTRPILA
jgi:hypothetical protein